MSQVLSVAALRPMDRVWLRYAVDDTIKAHSGVILSNNGPNKFIVIRGALVTQQIAYDDVIEFKLRNYNFHPKQREFMEKDNG